MEKIKIDDLEVEVSGTVKLEVRIGDYQPGSHFWKDGIRPEHYPNPAKSYWITKLRSPQGKSINFISSTRNLNPQTNWVSVDIKVNENLIEDVRLEKEVNKNELVDFDITIYFKP